MKRRIRLLLPLLACCAAFGAVGVSSAAAATATTGAATAVTKSSATVGGTVNTLGSAAVVEFVYGTSPTLVGGKTAGYKILAASTANQAISTNLTGLTAGTKYYYEATVAVPIKGAAPYYYYTLVPAAGTISSFTTSKATTTTKKSTLSFSSKTLKVKKNKASAAIKCSKNSTACKGTLTLTVKTKVKVTVKKKGKKVTKTKTKVVKIGSKSYNVKAGKKATIKISLNGAGKKANKHKKKLGALATAKAKTGKGFKNKKVTLKP